MKFTELKNKFKHKYAIRIVAGVLAVALTATGISVYDVSAAKNIKAASGKTVETEGKTKAGTDGQESEDTAGALEKALSSSISIGEKEIGKEETVYVIADSAGGAENIIVSDHLINQDGKKTIEDTSSLKDITNVKGDESYTRNGTKLIWQAEGKDIYYRGTSDAKIPVSQKITCWLDGKEIAPEKLAGKSGKVSIRFNYTNNQKVTAEIAGKETEICVPFAAVSGMVLNDSFTHIQVTNGRIISDGNKNLVVGYSLPGLKESLNVKDSDFDSDISIPDYFEVTADVEDFSLDMTMTAVMNAADFISGEGSGLSAADELINALNDATGQLSEGSYELADGVDTLRSKLTEFSGGVDSLKTGIFGYTEGVVNLADGIGSLKNGVDTLAGSVPALTEGVGKLKNGADSAAAGAIALSQGTGSLKKGAKDLSKGINDLAAGADSLSSGTGSLNTGVRSVAAGAKDLKAGAENLSAGADSLNAGVGTLVGKIQGMGAELAQSKENVFESFRNNAGLDYGDSANAALESLKGLQTALANGITAETKAAGRKAAGDNAGAQAAMAEALSFYGGAETGLSLPAGTIGNAAAAAAVMVQVSGKMADLQAGIAQVNGAVSVIDTVSGNLGSEETAGQLAALQSGAAALAEGSKNLAEGAGSLSAGADQTAAGAAELLSGAKELSKGAKAAAKGAKQVVDGAGEVENGASSLSQGLGTLDQGLTELNSKAGSLSGGVSQLKNGADQLAGGAAALTSNNAALTDGAKALADGTGALTGGVDALKSGARELADGIMQFNEEGIGEIINAYNGEIEPLAERIRAVFDAGADYQCYAGLSEGMNGSVKFIYKTAAIKPEK